jgi:hypothetical protein
MTSEVSFDPQTMLAAHLHEGETLRWVGKPSAQRMARISPQSVLKWLVPGLLFVLVITLDPDAVYRRRPVRDYFPVAIIYCIVVFVTIIATSAYQARLARRTAYGITDRRVLIVRQLDRSTEVDTYDYPLSLKRRALANGKSDVVFTNVFQKTLDSARGRKSTKNAGLFGIDNAEEVERLILQALPGSTSTVSGKGL